MSTLQDRQDIQDCLIAYAMGLDFRDFDLLESAFARNAIWDADKPPSGVQAPLHGARAIREAMQEVYAKAPPHRQGRHVITNVIFDELSANTARTRCYCTVLAVDKQAGSATLRGVGVYHDRLIRENGRWVIEERMFRVDHIGA